MRGKRVKALRKWYYAHRTAAQRVVDACENKKSGYQKYLKNGQLLISERFLKKFKTFRSCKRIYNQTPEIFADA